MAEHIVPWKTYLYIWIALMMLMVITAFLSTVNLGEWSTVVALAIAVTKAILVILFFMHVRYESQAMTAVVIIGGFFWLAILLTLLLPDYLARGWVGWAGH